MAGGPGNILVTGGGRGIGAATVRCARDAGYGVWFCYRTDEARAQALAEQTGAHPVHADVGDEGDVMRLFETFDAEAGHLDVLVNNAGIPGVRQSIAEIDAANLENVLRVNVVGSFLCAREATRRMARSAGGRGGSIVNVSSQAAVTGGYRLSPYAASKAALATMTIALSQELAGEGVRVNAVSPGLIDTEQQDFSNTERVESLLADIPLRRLGTPEDVARTILWLVSDEASYVNGAVIDVTGGR